MSFLTTPSWIYLQNFIYNFHLTENNSSKKKKPNRLISNLQTICDILYSIFTYSIKNSPFAKCCKVGLQILVIERKIASDTT